MLLTIERKWKKDTYTIGKLYIDGKEFSDTLEDKDRGLTSSMTIEEIKAIKIHGETAIPAGTYNIVMSYSPKFATRAWEKKYGGKVPEIQGVKGFSGIRIHPGNSDKDVSGCILTGKNTIKGQVTQSTYYYYRLLDLYILPAINRGESITLQIK